MSIDKKTPQEMGPAPLERNVPRPGEKLKVPFKVVLWKRAQALLQRFGIDLSGQNNMDLEKETVEQIRGIRNKEEDDKFLDIDLDRSGERQTMRMIAQVDPKYDPDREKDYDDWDLTPEEEARRWLNREILVAEKMGYYQKGAPISADQRIDSDRSMRPDHTMFLLKHTKEQGREWEQYGEIEGRALAQILLRMQTDLDATAMIKDIMEEESIKTKLEMEQKIFEDYFDHFDGYMENSRGILEDLGDEDMMEEIEALMESHREDIEACQLGEDEYSLVHGQVGMDTVIYSTDGQRANLADWQKAGKTQNRELSIVYDLGDGMRDAVERLDDISQIESFIRGAEAAIREHYGADRSDVAEAVIHLAKLRSFSMILNDMDGEKKEFIIQEMGL